MDRRAAWLAERQWGVASRRQLFELGVSADAITQRLRARRWRPIHPGIYLIGVFEPSQRTRWTAALLAAGASPALSHLSSAAARNLARERGGIHVSVPGRPPARKLDGVVVHRPRRLDPQDITRVAGFPATTVARTLLDIAETETAERLRAVAEEAERRELLDFDDVRACIARNPGRRGIAPLAALLDEYLPVEGTREGLERDFRLFVADCGLPTPLRNVLVCGLLVDFWWPEARLVVELDSRKFHAHWTQAERDRERDARMLREGIFTLRVTARRLRKDRDRLAGDVRSRFPGGPDGPAGVSPSSS